MGETLRHYGWLVSPYSAKTRAYLRYKGVQFVDVEPGVVQLIWKIRRAVGRPIMPTVQTEAGEWLQDSSVIIDSIEARLSAPPIVPEGDLQRLASLLLELHADEWLPLAALHYRWNFPENERFALDEFARSGFPWLPNVLGREFVRPFADKMKGYLVPLGVTAETHAGVERFTSSLIEHLETHLREFPFLLGTRPCMGDFALYGPLWAHLWRDPESRSLFESAPSVVAWFERLHAGEGRDGRFLEGDRIPETLSPIFEVMFREQFAYLRNLVDAIDAFCEANPTARRVPRSLGDTEFAIGGTAGSRKLVTFSQWMLQRPLDVYLGMDESSRSAADEWLTPLGGREAMSIRVRNRFVRKNYRVCLEHIDQDPA